MFEPVPQKPLSRVENYLAALALLYAPCVPPQPLSRVEAYLNYMLEEGLAFQKNGYFYNGKFYEDEEHTIEMEPNTSTIYFDNPTGRIYRWNGTDYIAVSGGSMVAGRFLSGWNCVTGLPITNPQDNPYPYHPGDYYIINTVAGSGGTNLKPAGSQYEHDVPSTTPFPSDEIPEVNDFVFYDGTYWKLIQNRNPTITIDQVLNPLSENAVSSKAVYNYLLSNYIAAQSGMDFEDFSYEDQNGDTGKIRLYAKVTPD